MGRKSSKDVMTLYKELRDARDLTREEVCSGKLDDHGRMLFEPMTSMTPERLEKIEKRKADAYAIRYHRHGEVL